MAAVLVAERLPRRANECIAYPIEWSTHVLSQDRGEAKRLSPVFLGLAAVSAVISTRSAIRDWYRSFGG